MPRDLPLSNGRLLSRWCPILPAHLAGPVAQTMRDHVRHSDQVPMLTGTAAGRG